MSDVRLRFAPSPTGYLHIGGLRTALFAWLYAKNQGGKMVLRIEDTDQTRKVEGAAEALIEVLEWAGVSFDEGPHKGGDYGPYIQSERLDIYKKHAQTLLDQGHAYRCFCTSERLDRLRASQKAAGLPPGYDRHCRSLSEAEINEKLAAGEAHVLRMKIPDRDEYLIPDMVRGNVRIQASQLDDQVIMKSDGFPTYHLASVVDDHEMKISHVIRGEEWLSSTPKHIQLYEFFGWQPPQFAHLGLLLNMDGTKLSKRQGDVAVEDYRAAEILPEALINFCALLGWSPGTNQEIFSISELIEQFSMEKVGKSGSKFNYDKLLWFNEQYIHSLDPERLTEYLMPHAQQTEFKDAPPQELQKAFAISQSALHNFAEIKDRLAVFFNEDLPLTDPAMLEVVQGEDAQKAFACFLEKLAEANELTEDNFGQLMKAVQKETGVKGAKLWKPFRYALTLEEHGPELPLMAGFFGKERVKKILGRYTG